MKKIIVLILSICYLTATVGATVHLHYCMDKVVDWGLSKDKDEKCARCGMEKNEELENGCCKDEQIHVKLENVHKATATYFLTEFISITASASVFEAPNNHLPIVTEQSPLCHTPLRCTNVAVYIRNCIFRI